MLHQTKIIASPLSRKATLTSVVVRHWEARKLDRKVTDKVNQEHGASSDTARVNKLLIEKKRLEKINSIRTKVRTLFYSLTKPWADEGLRILPNALHIKFVNEFRVLEREHDQAADEFAADYEMFIEERRLVMGSMFNPADYPHPSQIRAKFSLKVQHFPVPEADDFRSDVLDADTIEDIKRELAETSDHVLDNAMLDTKDQLVKVIGHLSKRLGEYSLAKKNGESSKLYDSVVGNVAELAELLPAFNFNNDPKFDELAKRIKSELCSEDIDALKKHEDVRDAVKKSADDILKDVESLLG